VINHVIIGKQGGKTYTAVQWLLEDPDHRVILTTSKLRAREIQRQYGLTTDQVVSAQGRLQAPHALKSQRYNDQVELAIDDLDEFLRRAFTFPVKLVTSAGVCNHMTVPDGETQP
jgi:hypothetical protein